MVLQAYKRLLQQHSTVVTAVEALVSNVTWLLPERFSASETPAEALNSASGLFSVFNEHLLSDSPGTSLQLLLSCLHQIEVLLEITACSLELHGSLRSRYSALLALEAVKAALRIRILQQSGSRILQSGGTATSSERGQAAVEEKLANAFHALHIEGAAAQLRAQPAPSPELKRCEVEPPLWWKAHNVPRAQCGKPASCPASSPPRPGCSGTLPQTRHKLSRIDEAALQEQTQSTGQLFWDTTDGAIKGSLPRASIEASESTACGDDRRPSGATAAGYEHAEASQAKGDKGQQHSDSPQSDATDRWRMRRRRGKRLLACGEALHIARPLVYVALLRRWGRRSWVPWLCSLACDLVSRSCTARGLALLHETESEIKARAAVAYQSSSPAMLQHLARVQLRRAASQEVGRRRLLLLWYMMRDPLYGTIISPQLHRIQASVSWIPLIGSLTSRGLDIVEGVQKYYVYTSAS